MNSKRGDARAARFTLCNLRLTRPKLLLLFVLLLGASLTGCRKAPQSPAPPPPSVTVSHPAQAQISDAIDLTGTVAPSKSVDLVARVTGYLQSVNFQEGSFVEAGQLLFVIEPEHYQQQLRLTEAGLLRAQSEYDRQLELLKENATSAANVEKWRSERDQAAAQVELAKLNLSYTSVTAPFAGRIGRRYVDPGNLVGPGTTVKLATLDQLSPIYVNFTLNERDALRLREAARRQGLGGQFHPGALPVYVGVQTDTDYPQAGTLDFVDSGVNPSTGTILMRATLKNEGWPLFPGLFARVRLPLGVPQTMLILPQAAIANDQEGDYVLVVNNEDVVSRRGVVKGPLTTSGCAIRSGLTASDRVIVNGQMRAKLGSKVTTVSPAATGTASVTLAH